jgi:hypothetical protein
MDSSYVVAIVVGWVVLSVPCSLLFGAFIGFGGEAEPTMSGALDRAA